MSEEKYLKELDDYCKPKEYLKAPVKMKIMDLESVEVKFRIDSIVETKEKIKVKHDRRGKSGKQLF